MNINHSFLMLAELTCKEEVMGNILQHQPNGNDNLNAFIRILIFSSLQLKLCLVTI